LAQRRCIMLNFMLRGVTFLGEHDLCFSTG
jgi:hypothetical protein